jgi:hypothetical protein
VGLKASGFLAGASAYVKKEDVMAGPQRMTIKNVEAAETPDKKPALQLVFTNDKKLTLNKTNGRLAAAQFGDDTDAWKGQAVFVYHDPTVMYAGACVGGIKIRPVDAKVEALMGGAPAAPPSGERNELGF